MILAYFLRLCHTTCQHLVVQEACRPHTAKYLVAYQAFEGSTVTMREENVATQTDNAADT